MKGILRHLKIMNHLFLLKFILQKIIFEFIKVCRILFNTVQDQYDKWTKLEQKMIKKLEKNQTF
jgi:hypothetical protein